MNLSSTNLKASSNRSKVEIPSTSNGNGSTKPIGMASSPWASSFSTIPSTSFENVMSEQLAVQLQLSEELELNNASFKEKPEQSTIIEDSLSLEQNTSNDALLAQMLQAKLDKEYNEYLAVKEEQVNKNSKVSVSYSNYRTDEMFYSSDDEYESSDDEILENGYSDQTTDMLNIQNNKGYVIFGKEVVTKHDAELCGRRNTARLENSFPTHFRTGDATGMDLQINNRIYNNLRKHAFSEEKRAQRLHENKQHSTAEHAIDERTRLILHRFIDRSIIASVNGVISIGKEAVVIHADGGDVFTSDLVPILNENNRDIACKRIPKECAIKVFKTTLSEFKTREVYIKDDYRFKDRFKKHNPRKLIQMWAEKEMHNLVRMFKARISCPEVVLLKKHVLVMSFIGEDHQAAPKLKNAILSSSQKIMAYEQVVRMMKTLFRECKLVHADLSEFNLLWHDKKVWVIDVSQAVEPSHPYGLEFLLRDCRNISKFFKNLSVPDVASTEELFNQVTGLEVPIADSTVFLKAIKEMQKSSEEHAHQGRNKSSQIFENNFLENVCEKSSDKV